MKILWDEISEEMIITSNKPSLKVCLCLLISLSKREASLLVELLD